jgi:CheY-like chemotaxis protein
MTNVEPQSRRKVLVVEDDSYLRRLVAEILQEEGYHVSCAANGQEALTSLRHAPLPGLILLDFMMPVMDGWEFRRQQQQDESLAPIPVVVLTGAGISAQEVASVGAAGGLLKPFDLPALLDAVDRHCA